MFEPLGREFLEQPDAFERRILDLWRREDLLTLILEARKDAQPFVFYEGPPTANGKPGIHHVLARTMKDSVCRYHTMRGEKVLRKAGWDTHGLPVELEVEKQLGISGKPEIEKFGVAQFNAKCRESVWAYKQDWEQMSERIGFLLDYAHPYVTYEKDYVESVWFLLSRFAANGLMYPGRKVLPWCGRCGTGLSSHEVSQGYQDIDDPSVWVSFPLVGGGSDLLRDAELVAWTTTPWTLPSNFAACVHPDFDYAVARIGQRKFVLLESKLAEVFGEQSAEILGMVKGSQLAHARYTPLFEWQGGRALLPGATAHCVVADLFVSAEEGTGVVHMAPYGADDFRIGQRENLPVRLCVGEDARTLAPIAGVPAGTFFRDANKELVRDLKQRRRLLKQAQYRHSYPHCWRCDTPLIYFPAPAWFLETTAYSAEMSKANEPPDRTSSPPKPGIQWSPPEIGSGRMGEWLAGNVDWALSRDRYWGTPLPVWECSADPEHWYCVESFSELAELADGLPADFDPHRPGLDEIGFACVHHQDLFPGVPPGGPPPTEDAINPPCPGRMRRVSQVIDCWFDSGAMPFAQHHWPFENRRHTREQFPANFIAEGVDQTRGWFYSLHAIGVFMSVRDSLWREPWLWEDGDQADAKMLADAGNRRAWRIFHEETNTINDRHPSGAWPDPGPAYRSCLVNGLLLDAKGQKMSKRLGNLVNPDEAIARHGVDAIRWSLMAAGAAHQSRRYDDAAIEDTRRRVLGTLASCYDFFALYAGTEGWTLEQRAQARPRSQRSALDRWILDRLDGTAIECAAAWEGLEPHLAARALDRLIVDHLSNWYVRRSRPRFWGGTNPQDQFDAFATLHEVLESMSRLCAPIAPFLAEDLARRLLPDGGSVHIRDFPVPAGRESGPTPLEYALQPVLDASKLGRARREKVGIRIRQPLRRITILLPNLGHFKTFPHLPSPMNFERELMEELNVKEVVWEENPDAAGVRTLIKPNFPTLGPKAGAKMKAVAAAIGKLQFAEAQAIRGGEKRTIEGVELAPEDVAIVYQAAAGQEAESDGFITIVLDTTLTPALIREGLAREVINRLQTQRKESGFAIGDRIRVRIHAAGEVRKALEEHGAWVAEETLAPQGLELLDAPAVDLKACELPDQQVIHIGVTKLAGRARV